MLSTSLAVKEFETNKATFDLFDIKDFPPIGVSLNIYKRREPRTIAYPSIQLTTKN